MHNETWTSGGPKALVLKKKNGAYLVGKGSMTNVETGPYVEKWNPPAREGTAKPLSQKKKNFNRTREEEPLRGPRGKGGRCATLIRSGPLQMGPIKKKNVLRKRDPSEWKTEEKRGHEREQRTEEDDGKGGKNAPNR